MEIDVRPCATCGDLTPHHRRRLASLADWGGRRSTLTCERCWWREHACRGDRRVRLTPGARGYAEVRVVFGLEFALRLYRGRGPVARPPDAR